MPSPIAHSAVALIAWPALHDASAAPPTRWRRLALLGALFFALCAPDLDILIGAATAEDAFADHGGRVHSLLAGAGFAVAFAVGVRLVVDRPWSRLWLIGTLAYWSHLVLDACTRGRGVMLLWPLSTNRFRLPFPLFYGVRHSPWGTWRDYSLMLVTELAFVGLVWVLSRRFRGRTRTLR